MNNALKSWIHNNITTAREALNQFLAEKNICFTIQGTPFHLKTDCNSFYINFGDCTSSPYHAFLKLPPDSSSDEIIETFICTVLSVSEKLESDFIEWLKPEFPEETNFDDIPIDKFDAVYAQKLAKKAIDLMTSEKEVRELSAKIRKEIKKAAERGEHKCIYYLSKDLSRETVGGAMKDLQASWFFVKADCAHNCNGNSLAFLRISWEKLNNGD